LEYGAEGAFAQCSTGTFGQASHRDTVERDAARAGRLQQAE